MQKIHPDINLSYTLIRTRRKSIALHIHPSDGLIVRAPSRISLKSIHSFIKSKEKWIRSKLDHYSNEPINEKINFILADSCPLLGGRLGIIRNKVDRKRVRVGIDPNNLIINHHEESTPDEIRRAVIREYRRYAQMYFESRTHQITKVFADLGYHKQPKLIKSREYKRRWGSTNEKGEITFNWKIILTDAIIIDYVIIHELVHLYHFNHSRDYWEMVKQFDPEYKIHIKWMKLYGHTLGV